MKFLITGLGNPGVEYQDTRHNVGFEVLDHLAKEAGISFTSGRYAHSAEVRHKGRIFILIKPSTFMNLSGNAVRYWLQKEGLEKSQLLVVTDDLALPFGKLRMRGFGSDGGHNGLKHITEILQSKEFARLRFGVGSDFNTGQQVDYVLGKWSTDEQALVGERLKVASEAIFSFGILGIERAMNLVNTR